MITIDIEKTYTYGEYSFINYTQLLEENKRKVLDWRNDESIRKNMYNTEEIPLDSHLAFIDSLSRRKDRYYWMVSCSGEPLGSVNITDVDYENSSAELGYYLRPDLMGGGKGISFIFNLLAFVFEVLGLNSLYGATNVENKPASLIDEYFGFKLTGQKKLIINGQETVFLEHILTASEFENNKEEKKDIENLIRFMRQWKKNNKNR